MATTKFLHVGAIAKKNQPGCKHSDPRTADLIHKTATKRLMGMTHGSMDGLHRGMIHVLGGRVQTFITIFRTACDLELRSFLLLEVSA